MTQANPSPEAVEAALTFTTSQAIHERIEAFDVLWAHRLPDDGYIEKTAARILAAEVGRLREEAKNRDASTFGWRGRP